MKLVENLTCLRSWKNAISSELPETYNKFFQVEVETSLLEVSLTVEESKLLEEQTRTILADRSDSELA